MKPHHEDRSIEGRTRASSDVHVAVLLDETGYPIGLPEGTSPSSAKPSQEPAPRLEYAVQEARKVLSDYPEGPFPLLVRMEPHLEVVLYRLYSAKSNACLHVLVFDTIRDSDRARYRIAEPIDENVDIVNNRFEILWTAQAPSGIDYGVKHSTQQSFDESCIDSLTTVSDCLGSGRFAQTETEIDGEPWTLRAYPLKTGDDDGKPIAVLRIARWHRHPSPAPSAVFHTDPGGSVIASNTTARRSYGFDDTALPKKVWDLVPVRGLRELFARALSTPSGARDVVQAGGTVGSVLGLEIFPILSDRGLEGATVSTWEMGAGQSEDDPRFRHLVENAGDVIYRYRILPEQAFEYVSPSVTATLGYTPEELRSGMTLVDLVDPRDRPSLTELLTGQVDCTRPILMRWNHRDGKTIWVEQTITPIYQGFGNRALLIEGVARNVTRRVEVERELHFLSFHDSLTGLYNRAYFHEEMARLQDGRDDPVSIISTDMDYLKIVNDTLGHHKGDEVIRAFADVMADTFRKSDVIARVGGDEFSVILSRTDSPTASEMVDRLRKNLENRNENHTGIPLAISIGYATRNLDEPLEETLGRADRSMYRVKLRRGESSVLAIIEYLLSLLWQKEELDPEHVTWMTDLALETGTALELPAHELSALKELTRVYDLGKVAVEDEVLRKSGSLTEGEWEQIRDHTSVGHRLALAVPHLSHISNLILHHHERWDGAGYPRGIGAREIPLSARILAVVDALGAMTRPRPYRDALTLDQALEEIRQNAGSQFDPQIVEVVTNLLTPTVDKKTRF